MARVAVADRVLREELLACVRSRHRYVLMTTRGDGRPQLSPVTGGVDDPARIVLSTYPGRAEAMDLRRNPAASVLVLSDDWDAWVQVDSIAEVLDMPSAQAGHRPHADTVSAPTRGRARAHAHRPWSEAAGR